MINNFVNLIKKHESVFIIFFLTSTFFLTIFPSYSNGDIWYHIKAGEIITKLGIIHHDVFAFTTSGREWFIFEWGFEVLVYYIFKLFGFTGIDSLIALLSTLIVFGIYKVLRNIFSLNIFLSVFFSLFYVFINSFLFFAPRPGQFSFVFLIWTIYLILLYIYKNRNYLYLALPIALVWTNMHGSIVLDVFLFTAYTFALGIFFLWKKEKQWLLKAKTLGIYSILTFIITILPPLWTAQYRQVLLFGKENAILTKFVSEWQSLYEFQVDHFYFFLYSGAILIVLTLLLFAFRKRRENIFNAFFLLPLVPLIIMPYINNRHFPFGSMPLILIAGFALSKFSFQTLSKIKKATYIIVVSFIMISFALNFLQYRAIIFSTIKYNDLPISAVKFIKNYDLKGNMFNEYDMGFYILSQLYPQKKVFIDGRGDLYLCCEMPLYFDLFNEHILEQNSIYTKKLDYIWKKYNISFAIIGTDKESYSRKIADILADDPSWQLVYWDDKNEIFIKKDGKNNNIIRELGVTAATPYSYYYYKSGMQNQALSEYYRMLKVQDSAKTRNGIGVILAQQGKLDEAKKHFLTATHLDPALASSFQNVAEIYIIEKNYEQAKQMYDNALYLANNESLPYVRLGQIYLEVYHDKQKAREIWEKGLGLSFDDQTKETFRRLLLKLELTP